MLTQYKHYASTPAFDEWGDHPSEEVRFWAGQARRAERTAATNWGVAERERTAWNKRWPKRAM